MKRRTLSLIAVISLFFLEATAQSSLKNGSWQARLHRADNADIVFNFEVKDSASRKVLYVLNAGERLLVDDITQRGDSVFINMPFFDASFRAVRQGNNGLAGIFVRHMPDREITIPFTAIAGVKERFKQHQPASANAGGRWATWFTAPGAKDSSYAIGEFKQQGNKVYGTFLTTTGDYRFLEGIVDGDTLKLSTFDGSHAYYFTARIKGDRLEEGVFYAGIGNGKSSWTAVKDDKAALQDERTLSTVKAGEESLNFTFPDLNGQQVSIKDDRFKNKVVVITLMGSWCPNCMDETGYLSNWYKENKQRGVEVIGLAYERTNDFEVSKKALTRFLKRFDVTYPVLVTGVTPADPKKGEKTLPQLTGIKGFPTTIFVDRQGKVVEVHTGFNGPGTGEHYEVFKKEFNQLVDRLVAAQ